MTLVQALRYLPFAALAAGFFTFGLIVRLAIQRVKVQRRPALLAGMILGALPALYVGLTWAALFSDSYLRLARPWVTLLCLAATAFLAVRLATPRGKQGKWRLFLGDPPEVSRP